MSASALENLDWLGEHGVALRLEDGRLSGSGGINRLMGEYRLEVTSLTFGPIATTMMAGPPEQMEREQRFLADVARVAQWSLDGDQLVLRDGAGTELIRLDHPPSDKESTMELMPS